MILKSAAVATHRRCISGGCGDSAAATARLRRTVAAAGFFPCLRRPQTAAEKTPAAAPLTSLLKIAVRYAFVTEGPHTCLKFNHCVAKISTVSTAQTSYYRANHTQPRVFTLRVDFDSKLQFSQKYDDQKVRMIIASADFCHS